MLFVEVVISSPFNTETELGMEDKVELVLGDLGPVGVGVRVGDPAPNGGGVNGTVARGKPTVGGRVGLESGIAEYATINRIINGCVHRVRVAHNWRTRTGTWYGTGG